jgi:hypothetical protein
MAVGAESENRHADASSRGHVCIEAGAFGQKILCISVEAYDAPAVDVEGIEKCPLHPAVERAWVVFSYADVFI